MILTERISTCAAVMLIAIFSAACGGVTTGGNSVSTVTETIQSQPFTVVEPQQYSAAFTVNAAGNVSKYRVARDGNKRRLEVFDDAGVRLIAIESDKRYTILPRQGIYSAEAQGTAIRDDLDGMIMPGLAFFGTMRPKLEREGTDGDMEIYSSAANSSGEMIRVTFDPRLKMIVRQEVSQGENSPKFVYQLTDVKLEVDEKDFQPPQGMRLVTPAQLGSAKEQ